MAVQEIELNTTGITDEQLKVLAFHIGGLLSKNGVWNNEPLDREGAAKFCKVSTQAIDRLRREGKITAHYPGGIRVPLFLPSELVEFIKKS